MFPWFGDIVTGVTAYDRHRLLAGPEEQADRPSVRGVPSCRTWALGEGPRPSRDRMVVRDA